MKYLSTHKLGLSRLTLICLLLCMAAGSAQTKTGPKEKTYVFGLLPFMSPLALYKRFSPLQVYLNQSMRANFVLETSKNFSAHLANISRRKYDFVLTAPHFVLPSIQSKHYRVVATYTKPLSAVIVVHKDSKITHISDLKGSIIATPPPKAIITIVGRQLFADNKLHAPELIQFKDYPSHNSAYHAVLAGEVKAAVVAIYVYLGAKKKGAPLKLIAKSYNFPAVGILAANDLPDTVVQLFVSTLVEMNSNPHGRRALKQMAFPGYKKANANDYQTLQNITIPKKSHRPSFLKDK